MQGWHYGKGLIYYRSILKELAVMLLSCEEKFYRGNRQYKNGESRLEKSSEHSKGQRVSVKVPHD